VLRRKPTFTSPQCCRQQRRKGPNSNEPPKCGGLAEEITRPRVFSDHGNGEICENWNPEKGFVRSFGEGRRGRAQGRAQ
ncbi:unnamed protein product, partial [Musa acuminata subsp. burmannicoides]